MSWGGLNPALTAWRTAYTALLPDRGTASDGARADSVHGATSQHQEDADDTVDANDMDVNVFGSSTPTGTPAELAVIEALKADFMGDPYSRAQLWIHDREIANTSVASGTVRHYGGDSPHDKHVHWESRQSREHIGADWPMPHTTALLRRMGKIVEPKDIEKIAQRVYALLAPKLDAAMSAWDDAFGRDANRQTAGEALIEIRNNVRDLVATDPGPVPADPA